jgi:hypothetical protein
MLTASTNRAAVADQGDALAPTEIKVEPVERRHVSVVLLQAARAKNRIFGTDHDSLR